jgi:anhydro-N-acetylmuramic acid kinase
MKKHRVLGIMSGSSLDGLDLAYCEFEKNAQKWHFAINDAITFPYNSDWKERLWNALRLSGHDLIKLDFEYGRHIGKLSKEFIKEKKINIDFISSHGHTIFHKPTEGITFQLGNGASIAAESETTTVCNFRTLDVALKGQGAPLVAIGDMLLFSEYDCCLNLGGFANISYEYYNKRIAFDICPVNFVLNYISQLSGFDYDKDGNIGRSGQINITLLDNLNSLSYYAAKQPKSLGREWVEKEIFPLINNCSLSVEEKIRTFYEHIVFQIDKSIKGYSRRKILVTGGGTHNLFLMDLLKQKSKHNYIIPDKKLVDYKEALIFGFLGVLKIRNQYNCIATVTGANHDSIGGIIFKI